MTAKVWINGHLLLAEEARIAYNDHGLTVGDGVFETLKAYGGRPFAVRRHLDRLAASAAGLALPAPDVDALRAALDEVVAANDLGDAALRITYTAGPGPLGSARGTDGTTLVVAGMPLTGWPPSADVAVVPWPRNERGALSGLKTTSYGENVVALAHARAAGASEAIFANTVGALCEGTGTNVFLGVDGRLVTPPLSSGCLAGVTRALLLEHAGAVEEELPLEALRSADEAFLASTTREVQPIRAVDGVELEICPGPLTSGAAAVFRSIVADSIDP